MTADDMVASGMRGKGFVVVHTANDELIKFGKDKPKVPLIPDLELTAEEIDEAENTEDDVEEDKDVEESGSKGDSKQGCDDVVKSDSGPAADGEMTVELESSPLQEPIDDSESKVNSKTEAEDDRESLTGLIADILLGTPDNCEEENKDHAENNDDGATDSKENELPSTSIDDAWSSVSMDDRLLYYFKVAMRFHLRPSTDLPATPQEVYKAMQSACPEENILDFRKSTFKKPLKFFQEMQAQGLLKLKEESKGVWVITDIDKSSDIIRQTDFEFLPYLTRIAEEEDDDDTDTFQPPVVKEMLSVNANVLPLFRDAGLTKGTGVSAADMRKIVTDYVRRNELCPVDAADKSRVKMNPEIAGILLEKGENDVVELTWNQIFQRLPKKMGQCYSLEYPGMPPIFKKGGLPPVMLNVETRSGNKKVTLVTNLETYGVNPKDLAKEIRVSAAASSSVSAAPGQKVGAKQLLIQGNQVNLIVALLTEKYNIEKKHINGIEKGEKKKKR